MPIVAAYGIPSSMWVAWFSPSVRRSRITAHDASFEIVDSMPYFLKSPSSWAITIDEQSVSAMMPILTFGVSGPSAAYTPPAQPAGTPASSAAALVVSRNCRRVRCTDHLPDRKMAPGLLMEASAPSLSPRRVRHGHAAPFACTECARERPRGDRQATSTLISMTSGRSSRSRCRISVQTRSGCRRKMQPEAKRPRTLG